MKTFFKIILWLLFYLFCAIPVYALIAEVGGWLAVWALFGLIAPFSIFYAALWKWIDRTIETRESPQDTDLHPKKSI